MAGMPADGDPPADRCVFCDIIARRSPAWMVYEDPMAVAFLDIFPFTRGHLLVVPRHHGARLTDLPVADQAGLVRALNEVLRRCERLTPDYNLALNAGRAAGQIVFHVHFHVIPRYGEANPFRGTPRLPLAEGDAKALVAALSRPEP